jgi:DNA-3-methyladenine glycosylase II
MDIELPKPTGFSLRAAGAFYDSFTPGSGMAAAGGTTGLDLVFRLDGTFTPIGVSLSESARTVTLRISGTRDADAVRRQVTRMLGLDADGEAWWEVGRRDPVVGRLQREFPGFFTASKSSPYDAATWAVISPRLSIAAAATVKRRIAREHGDVVIIDQREHCVFPSPRALLQLRDVDGLSDEKIARLHAVAEAALAGKLDGERLRTMPQEAALAELQKIRGIGPWGASHIYVRGAAPRDALPTVEPRVIRGWAAAAGLSSPTVDAFVRAGEAWRPFRTWVAVLMARHLARSGGWNAPGLAGERARAIRRGSRARGRLPTTSDHTP